MGKGLFRKIDGQLAKRELDDALEKLPDNTSYSFLIVDERPNRALPYLTILFSVVLKAISDQLPGNPSTEALYRYFEQKFAPRHTCMIHGLEYEYYDLKREKNIDIGNFIERVAKFAREKWDIEIPDGDLLKDPKQRELYSEVYKKQEVDWSRFISSRK